MFCAVCEESVGAKLSTVQSVKLHKSKKIVGYSSRILELVGRVESAGHTVSAIECKHVFLRA